MTEKELIKRCSLHDSIAQEELYRMYAPKMLGVCIRYVRDRELAQDLMHDGFITVFSKIGDFRGDGSFEGWMRRVFVNTALGHLRKNNVLAEAAQIDVTIQLSNHDSSAIERLGAKELMGFIETMPEGYRTVLNMFAIEGYSHREIAQMLNISEGTSRSQYLRAKAYLHKVLKEAEVI